MTAPTRRGVLGGIAALSAPVLLAAGFSAGSADAEMVRLAAAVVAGEAAYQATYVDGQTIEEERASDPERERLSDLYNADAEALAEMVPVSLAGVVAKARAAIACAVRSADGDVLVHDNAEALA